MSPAIRGNDYAKGNPGGGAPTGNDNAVGNDGGAPAGNWNAAKHHGWSDPLKHYHRLAGEPRETVDRYIEEFRDEYARYHGIDETDAITVESHIVATREFDTEEEVRDAFRKVGAIFDQRWRTNGPVFDEGMVVEEEVEFETPDGETVTYTNVKANPALEASHRLFWKRRGLEVDLGLIENERTLSVWLD
jgi:hypothetical protein